MHIRPVQTYFNTDLTLLEKRNKLYLKQLLSDESCAIAHTPVAHRNSLRHIAQRRTGSSEALSYYVVTISTLDK